MTNQIFWAQFCDLKLISACPRTTCQNVSVGLWLSPDGSIRVLLPLPLSPLSCTSDRLPPYTEQLCIYASCVSEPPMRAGCAKALAQTNSSLVGSLMSPQVPYAKIRMPRRSPNGPE